MAALALYGCGQESPAALVAAAKASLAKNEPGTAVIQLKGALDQEPDRPEARFLLGRSLLEAGDPAAAAVELRKALELNQPPDAVLPVLARALLGQGEHRQLLAAYAATQLTDPGAAADLATSLALAHLRAGDKEAATAELQAALKARPDFVPAHLLQVSMLAAGGNRQAALAELDQVLQRAPAEASAWLLRGDLLATGGADPAGAIEAWRKALGLRKDLAPAHVGIVSLLLAQRDYAAARVQIEAMKKALPKLAQTTYFEALLALQTNDLVLAGQLADQLLAAAPKSPDALRLAGTVALQKGELPKAQTLLAGALQAAPANRALRRLLTSAYLRGAQPERAVQTVQPLVDSGEPDAETLTLAAVAHVRSGDFKQADALFAAAAKLKPGDARTRTALAISRLGGADAAVALDELQQLATEGAGSAADFALISAHVQRKEFTQALAAVDALQRKQPDQPLAATLRGQVQMARGDVVAARASFEQALRLGPTHFPACAALAALDLRDKKPEQARQRFETLLQRDPKSVQALIALAALREQSGAAREEVASLLTRAIAAEPNQAAPRVLLIDYRLRSKDYKAALDLAQEGLAAQPDSAQLVDALGRVQFASGERDQALKAFRQLAALDPASPGPPMKLAEVQLAMKDTAAAAQSLARALALKPDFPPAVEALIGLHLAAGRADEALALARGMQKRQPTSANGFAYEGGVQASLKQWAAAAAAFRAGLKIEPARTELAVKLHEVLGALAQPAEAARLAAAWRKDHPKDFVFLTYLGDLALKRQDYAQAEADFQAVAALRPDSVLALNNIAWLRATLKKPGAVGYAERANALMPGNPSLMDTLAMALAEDQQLTKALELQKKALALQPENPGFRLNLAKIYLKAGDKALARTELDQLARLGDKFVGQAEVDRLLKSL